MKYLLDTHVAVWWFADDPALPPPFGTLLDDLVAAGEVVGISAIKLWEIAMLGSRGRLRLGASVDAFIGDVEDHPVIRVLPISGRIAMESTRLGDGYPRDQADRLIGATARCHALRLLTADERIRASGVVALA